MVVRLEGKIDGQTVIFQHVKGDEWKATIPKSLSGIYIVELTAWDEAGNIGYVTKYLVTINPGSLKVCLKPFEWQCQILEPIVSLVESSFSEFYSNYAELSCYDVNVYVSEYVSQIIGWG